VAPVRSLWSGRQQVSATVSVRPFGSDAVQWKSRPPWKMSSAMLVTVSVGLTPVQFPRFVRDERSR